ncbi:hypothetical protein GOP47_0000441 [Adiantum capillus-veneris]|uniref:Probable enoyl-CoA hydratase, mitochondrial n=1 Tax=Adiantum capillus-veneris TaxID=13818 RepID=A0A9D4VDJ4_ADICA|nr:hypothetical protein GOP47_0000441 [Adiantum capillus-veneris]
MFVDSACKALQQLHFSSSRWHPLRWSSLPGSSSNLNFSHSISSSGLSGHASDTAVHSASDALSKQIYKCIEVTLVEQETVGLIVLNRPEVLNALSEDLMHELVDALRVLDSMQKVGAMIITGKGKAFAAGADIKDLKDKNIADIFMLEFPSKWNDVSKIKKPIIAAVNGYALGGGCEVALMCDIILAGEKAVFGQPEINLGTIPGMGGTQRLIREVGKSSAMEMILTGSRFLDAQEAYQRGLASRVVAGSNDELVKEAISVAAKIALQSRPAVVMAKAAVNSAYELGLHEGVKKEQALFGATFALADQKEGMSAFIEKRQPQFVHT